MGLKIRMEGSALDELEAKEKAAAKGSASTYENYKESESVKAIEEAKELGISDGDSGYSSSDNSSSESSDSESDEGGDDNFDFGGDDFGDPPGDDLEGDGDSEDDSSDDDEEEPEPEEEPPTEAEEDAGLKTESFRNMDLSFTKDFQLSSMQPTGFQLRQEFRAYDNSSILKTLIYSIGVGIGGSLLAGSFKLVAWLWSKTLKGLKDTKTLFQSSIAAEHERGVKNEASLIELRKALETAASKSDGVPRFEQPIIADIRNLVFGQSPDVLTNVKTYTAFVENRYKTLAEALDSDLNDIAKILNTGTGANEMSMLNDLAINPRSYGFDHTYGKVYSKDGSSIPLTTCGMGPMIGNVELKANLLLGPQDNWEAYEKGFTNSKVFMTVPEVEQDIKVVPLNFDQLYTLSKQLAVLVNISKEQEKKLSWLEDSTELLFQDAKKHFIGLTKNHDKYDKSNSLGAFCFLRYGISSKVTLVALKELQDHTQKVIVSSITLINRHIKHYS